MWTIRNGQFVNDPAESRILCFDVPREQATPALRLAVMAKLGIDRTSLDGLESEYLAWYVASDGLHAYRHIAIVEGNHSLNIVPFEAVLAALGQGAGTPLPVPAIFADLKPGMKVRLKGDDDYVVLLNKRSERFWEVLNCAGSVSVLDFDPNYFPVIQDVTTDLDNIQPGMLVRFRQGLERGELVGSVRVESEHARESELGATYIVLRRADFNANQYALFGFPYWCHVEMFDDGKPYRKPKENPLLREFATADVLKARSMIRCGFELETQETEGLTCDGSSEPDYDRARDYASERVAEWDTLMLLEYADSDGFFAKLLYRNGRVRFRKVCEALFDTGDPTLEQLAKYDDSINVDEAMSAAIDAETDYILENWSEYFGGESCDPEDVFHDLPHGMVAETDMSVSGFEFHTDGPQTYAQFMRHANWIFKKSHVIDTGCSFHIHLSIPGVKPKQGKHTIRRMVEYIINHMSELPESVQNRIRRCGQNEGRFFRPQDFSYGKSSFINFHEQGTWEFRGFGNVQNASEAKRCLDMAIRAMHYAYRVRFEYETETDLTEAIEDMGFCRLATKAAETGKTLAEVAMADGYIRQAA